jgi:hypothetical protein
MSLPTHSSRKLAERIKLAIDDCKLTVKEHDEILAIAHADKKVDPHEKALIDQLKHLVDNGTVKLVP